MKYILYPITSLFSISKIFLMFRAFYSASWGWRQRSANYLSLSECVSLCCVYYDSCRYLVYTCVSKKKFKILKAGFRPIHNFISTRIPKRVGGFLWILICSSRWQILQRFSGESLPFPLVFNVLCTKLEPVCDVSRVFWSSFFIVYFLRNVFVQYESGKSIFWMKIVTRILSHFCLPFLKINWMSSQFCSKIDKMIMWRR